MANFEQPNGVPIKMKYSEDELKSAHSKCRHNKVRLASNCSCFHCLQNFPASQINKWVDREGTTAVCPFCGIDSVISEADPDLLRQLQERYFRNARQP